MQVAADVDAVVDRTHNTFERATGVVESGLVVGRRHAVLRHQDRDACVLGRESHGVFERVGVHLPTGQCRRGVLGRPDDAVGTQAVARVGLDAHEVVVARDVEPVELGLPARRVTTLLASIDGLEVGERERPTHLGVPRS